LELKMQQSDNARLTQDFESKVGDLEAQKSRLYDKIKSLEIEQKN
jgi:chromosome segregation ATPase